MSRSYAVSVIAGEIGRLVDLGNLRGRAKCISGERARRHLLEIWQIKGVDLRNMDDVLRRRVGDGLPFSRMLLVDGVES
jgi:hypothetical protein